MGAAVGSRIAKILKGMLYSDHVGIYRVQGKTEAWAACRQGAGLKL